MGTTLHRNAREVKEDSTPSLTSSRFAAASLSTRQPPNTPPDSEIEESKKIGSDKPPPAKKVRLPKGKKVKPENEQARIGDDAIGPTPYTDPSLAAKERAKRRSSQNSELCNDDETSAAEVSYRGLDYDNFIEDGVQFEPFSLEKEREEGYFDADGSFVEYVDKNQVKDAWLDSIKVVDPETKMENERRRE